jgi:hypothetical protein
MAKQGQLLRGESVLQFRMELLPDVLAFYNQAFLVVKAADVDTGPVA